MIEQSRSIDMYEDVNPAARLWRLLVPSSLAEARLLLTWAVIDHLVIHVSFLVGLGSFDTVSIWPSLGVALFVLYRFRTKALIPIFLADFLYAVNNLDWSVALPLFAASNTIFAYLGVEWFRRGGDFSNPVSHRANTARFMAAAGVAALGSATTAAFGLTLITGLTPATVVPISTRWLLADFSGAVMIAPSLLLLFSGKRKEGMVRSIAPFVGVSLLFVAIVTFGHVFAVEQIFSRDPTTIALVPLTLIIALQRNSAGICVSYMLVALGSCIGPYLTSQTDAATIIDIQLFSLALIVAGMFIHAVANEARGAMTDLAAEREELEERVIERTSALADALARTEAADKAKSAFLANTSHEVRTPLNGILGMADVLLETRGVPDDIRPRIEVIRESGHNLLEILNDILDISKIEAGQLTIDPQPVDIRAVITDQERLWSPRAKAKGLAFTLSINDDLPELLMIDDTRLSQCVGNLLSNAIKFTAKGGVSLTVGGEAQVGSDTYRLKIAVRDTGVGIEQEVVSTLFQPFVQADISTTRNFGGTGLGLSITRSLARAMGGDVSVESSFGEGSMFELSLPVPYVEQRLAKPASQAPQYDISNLNQLSILLADDVAINRQVITGMLESLNATIIEAANGHEVLVALEDQRFDLILLDMHMPEMDGPETVAAIRAHANPAIAATPIIAVTADAMKGDRERYMALGIEGYVSKPLSMRRLVAEINAAGITRRAA